MIELTGADFLQTMAQIALGLAGFAGLMGIFRIDHFYTPTLALIIEASLLIVMAAIIPFGFATILETQEEVWQASSLVVLVFVIAIIIQIMYLAWLDPDIEIAFGPFTFFILVLGLIFVVLLFMNAFIWKDVAVYVWVHIALMFSVSIQFVLLISDS